ncbi:MAG TPA: PASTA domain-containing protein [Gemmatimonadales bacterium]|nr:PASTA domain-containing protein [Gemmatimonadales bacterium]
MRVPRHMAAPFLSTAGGRRLLKHLGIVFGSTVAGYLVAALWLYPAPLFTSDLTVPRVLELTGGEAQRRLIKEGFRVKFAGTMPHPKLPIGEIVWQDPPPLTAYGQGAMVQLYTSSGPAQAAIPDVVGLDGALATRVLNAGGFTIKSVDSVSASSERGSALATRPAAGVALAPGASVVLVVSAGPASTSIPDVTGLSSARARDALFKVGLSVGRVTPQVAAGKVPGTVIGQRPAAGALAAKDGRVDLIVAKAP